VTLLLLLRLGDEFRIVTVDPAVARALREHPGVARSWLVRWRR